MEASAARCPKKTLNPAIKFYEATYHYVRGGKKHLSICTLFILSFIYLFIHSFVHSIACKKNNNLHACVETKAQISRAVTARLISAFVFATQIYAVQSLFFLNLKSRF